MFLIVFHKTLLEMHEISNLVQTVKHHRRQLQRPLAAAKALCRWKSAVVSAASSSGGDKQGSPLPPPTHRALLDVFTQGHWQNVGQRQTFGACWQGELPSWLWFKDFLQGCSDSQWSMCKSDNGHRLDGDRKPSRAALCMNEADVKDPSLRRTGGGAEKSIRLLIATSHSEPSELHVPWRLSARTPIYQYWCLVSAIYDPRVPCALHFLQSSSCKREENQFPAPTGCETKPREACLWNVERLQGQIPDELAELKASSVEWGFLCWWTQRSTGGRWPRPNYNQCFQFKKLQIESTHGCAVECVNWFLCGAFMYCRESPAPERCVCAQLHTVSAFCFFCDILCKFSQKTLRSFVSTVKRVRMPDCPRQRITEVVLIQSEKCVCVKVVCEALWTSSSDGGHWCC